MKVDSTPVLAVSKADQDFQLGYSLLFSRSDYHSPEDSHPSFVLGKRQYVYFNGNWYVGQIDAKFYDEFVLADYDGEPRAYIHIENGLRVEPPEEGERAIADNSHPLLRQFGERD